MPRPMIDIASFHARVASGARPQGAVRRLAVVGEPMVAPDSRTVSFVFSDGSTDRYGDRIDARGWVLDNFNANPVALFGHDSGSVENIIGRAANVRVQGAELVGDIEFMEGSVNQNAEAVYQMVKGGYLRTVSVGFQPLDWVPSKDKGRPGGIDFRKQELLEISIVPIPANPNALVQARAAGIEVDRLALVEAARAEPRIVTTKGLYQVSFLAGILADLGYLEESVEWEAASEGDGSPVPQQLTDALKALGQVLIAMTVEEVGELVADGGGEAPLGGPDGPDGMMLAQWSRSTIAQAVRAGAFGPVGVEALARAIERGAVEVRAGRVLSAENEQSLRDAHGAITDACDVIKGVIGKNQPPADDGQAAEARARRVREAQAIKLAHEAA